MTKPGDHVPPPRISQRELAAQYVGEIVKQQAEEAAQARAPTPRRRGRALSILVVLAPVLAGLTIWNVIRLARAPALFTAEQEIAGLRVRMYFAAQAITAYRDSIGSLPASLEAVGMENQGFIYQQVDSTYVLVATDTTDHLRYRGDQDPVPFAEAYWELPRQQGAGR